MNEAIAKGVERDVRTREEVGKNSRRVGSTTKAERRANPI